MNLFFTIFQIFYKFFFAFLARLVLNNCMVEYGQKAWQLVTVEEDVVEKGAGFLEGLLNILSNPESTQRLVNNITETDRETGQTYLKLPISNAGVVEYALKVLSGLFGGMGKK